MKSSYLPPLSLTLLGLSTALFAGDASSLKDAPARIINAPHTKSLPPELAAEIAASKELRIEELCLLASQWVSDYPDFSDEILQNIINSREYWPDEHLADITHAVSSATPTELLATDISTAQTEASASTTTPVSTSGSTSTTGSTTSTPTDFVADVSTAKEKVSSGADEELISLPSSVTDAD